MEHRDFLKRATALTGAVSGLAVARTLLSKYAEAQIMSLTNKRIKAKYVTGDSPGGNSGKMRGYLVYPAGAGPFPAVFVVHDNRGVNPHIEDIARHAELLG
jgi:carboxymethylenebutenolidase